MLRNVAVLTGKRGIVAQEKNSESRIVVCMWVWVGGGRGPSRTPYTGPPPTTARSSEWMDSGSIS